MSDQHETFDQPDLTEGVLSRRVFAWLVDFVAIGILVAVAVVAITVLGFLTFGLGWGLLAALPALGFCYHALFIAGRRAATPGMRLLDITARHEDDLARPSLAQAVVFTAGLWLTLSFAAPLLLIALVTRGRREVHDMAAGLVVVREGALTRSRGFVNMGPGMPYR